MSNGCWTRVRSFCGSSLYLASVASRANSLPPNHTATFRPLRSAGVLIPDVLNASSRMPLYPKIWPIVDQRHALLARGQEARQPVDPELRAPARHHLLGHDVRSRPG